MGDRMKDRWPSLLLALVLSLVLIIEYCLIRFYPAVSGLHLLKAALPELVPFQVTTEPSGLFGLTAAGLGSFCFFVTFCHSLRKRIRWLEGWGKLPGWVEVHVLFGSMGPVFILLHTDFRQRGLAGVAFWSMVVVLVSGLMGHFFERPNVSQMQKGKTNFHSGFIKNQAIFRHWDAFHGPFAILLLLTASSHIVLGLLFLVRRELP
jgi:hypothetical protein